MRTQILFDNVDASQDYTMDITYPFEQDLRFLIQIEPTGTDANPKLYIEESVNQTMWTAMRNPDNGANYFSVSELIGIKDNYFMGKYWRVRLEANGTTTGTIYGVVAYKTKP